MSLWSALVVAIMILLTTEEDLKSGKCPKSCKFQVTILDRDKVFCGGILLSLQWILTAAHCVYKREIKKRNILARVEFSDGYGQVKEVVKGTTHKKSTTPDLSFDIGLLFVKNSFKTSKDISPARLPKKSFMCTSPNINLVLWDHVAEDQALICCSVILLDVEPCYRAMNNMRDGNKLRRCLKTNIPGLNYSIGPLMCDDVIMGIVFTSKRVRSSTLALYDITDKYADFFKTTIKNQELSVGLAKLLLFFCLCLFLMLNLCS